MSDKRSVNLRQQWEEIGFDAVGLWRHLCRWDYRRAAVGLLQDLLKELHDHEDPTNDAAHLKNKMLDGTTLRDHLIAKFREQLMQVLGDPDGQELQKWQQLYREYRYVGVDQENEIFLRNGFLYHARNLVVTTASELQAEAEEDDMEEGD
jgi:hypothetical protein